jgi:putative transposase
MIDTAIEELAPLVGVRAACAATGRAHASYYRVHSKQSRAQSDTFTSTTEKVAAPPTRRESAQPRALSAAEREHVLEVLNCERFADMAPAAVHATLLDEGVYLCSESTMYRLLRERNQTGDRRRHATHPAAVKPEPIAYQPNSAWSWDIERREALSNRTGVRDHRRRVIAVARQKLGAA